MFEVEYVCPKASPFIQSMDPVNIPMKLHNVLSEIFAVGSSCLRFISSQLLESKN